MLEYRQKRLEIDPLLFNDLSPSNGKLDSLEFRRVRCKGVFDEKRSVYVGPRSRSISGVTENGYYVITPGAHPQQHREVNAARVLFALSVIVT